MNKKIIAAELLKVAELLMAVDFPTDRALKKYLKEHPDADRRKHRVVKKKQQPKKKQQLKKQKAPLLSLKEHTHKLPKGTKVRVYDNGGETMDRFDIVIDDKEWDTSASPGMKPMLSVSENPSTGVSQFGDGKEGDHLGKKIKFTSLPKNVQEHVIKRIEEDS